MFYLIEMKMIEIFSKYYTPNIEIKDYNLLIYGKSFFDVPIKNKQEAYEKLWKWEGIMIIKLVIH